jgi:hypothetical protein
MREGRKERRKEGRKRGRGREGGKKEGWVGGRRRKKRLTFHNPFRLAVWRRVLRVLQ